MRWQRATACLPTVACATQRRAWGWLGTAFTTMVCTSPGHCWLMMVWCAAAALARRTSAGPHHTTLALLHVLFMFNDIMVIKKTVIPTLLLTPYPKYLFQYLFAVSLCIACPGHVVVHAHQLIAPHATNAATGSGCPATTLHGW